MAIPTGFSIQDYLLLESSSHRRHEYRGGMVYPIQLENDDHRRIRSNLSYLIATNLQRRAREFQLFTGDARISDGDSFLYYPDLFVTVDVRDVEDSNTKCYPKLIVEVVSPATELFDRSPKFEDYRQLNSLEEYLLIDRDTRQVERRHRIKEGNWQRWDIETYQDEKNMMLSSLGVKMSLEELYRGVSWSDPFRDDIESKI
ncbi:Uma2 family endonuclease [Oscillatoria sp. FACHB-1406]|uniref:Uma2 family endonuclease n=1 Tax=Oscillatoria sp. FACHB-1406 TaxID=2692846 RepID=UPI0016834E66|nr:Uma2 family endonuclease [Oscillatoria sp. FACHB-1406]MBD2580441.1 Uma2 family endonuclease [Oscillatoria sp. FACHB-1406]